MASLLSSLFRPTEAGSPARKLVECDESLSLIEADVEQLTEELERVRAGASPLTRWLADRETVLAERELELTRVENERLAAQRRADDAAAALLETRMLLQEHDGRVTTANRELADLRSRLAERDRELDDAERERARLNEALAERAEALARRDTRPVDEREADRQGRTASGAAGHVLFAPFPEGYRLVSSDEPCPGSDEIRELEGHSFVVTRVGRSPFPADRRPCAFLELRTAAA